MLQLNLLHQELESNKQVRMGSNFQINLPFIRNKIELSSFKKLEFLFEVLEFVIFLKNKKNKFRFLWDDEIDLIFRWTHIYDFFIKQR